MSVQGNSPFQRHRKSLKSDMNVVPYIDVMLVLLVIFMVTAPMLTTGLTVDLPDAPTDSLAVSKDLPAIVTIKAGKQYFLRLNNGADEALSVDAIRERLQALQQTNPALSVLLNADQTVPYGDVVVLMASLQHSGLKQVGLLTEAPAQ